MLISHIVGPRESVVVEIESPTAAADQVVVDVLACGVCSSDTGPWTSGPDAGSEPLVIGHEIVGRIREVGANATRWQIGDLVTGLGQGGFATQAALNTDRILPVPAGIRPEIALGEPLAVVASAVGRSGAAAGQRIAIVGLGFIGLGILQMIKTMIPRTHLVVVDRNPAARARALAAGADEAYAPDEVPEPLRSGSAGHAEQRMDVVFEVVGSAAAFSTAGALVRPNGNLCVVGYHRTETISYDIDLWYKGVRIINSFSAAGETFLTSMQTGLELLAQRRIDFDTYITHTFALEQVDAAYEMLTARTAGFVKAIVIP